MEIKQVTVVDAEIMRASYY